MVVTVVSLGLAAAISVAAVWLAALGVRERQRLRPERERPRLRLGRLALRAVGPLGGELARVRAARVVHPLAGGLGFHGLSCLFGPVHRNALPLLSALALARSGARGGGQHLHAWIRAAVARAPRRRLVIVLTASLACRPRARAPLLGAEPVTSRGLALRRCRPEPGTDERKESDETSHLWPLRAAAFALVLADAAFAHAIVSPPVAKAKVLQQFTLSVPTEEEGATTTRSS